jgi:hypothetical protein
MKIFAFAAAFALFVPLASAGIASADGQAAQAVLVPAGTSIPVHLVGSISSATAKAGDTFQIQAADDVVVDHMIVVHKGAGGEGAVTEVDSAGGNGHSGSLGLTFSYVYSADGGRIKLSDATQKQAEEDRKGASSTATIIGFATFGLGGLFGHNLAHGRDKKLDETTVITAFVAGNVHVETAERAEDVKYDK